MSDAACDQNNNSKLVVATTSTYSLAIIEEHWRKGIILVQIWREVLRVILFAGGPGEGLDEKSKREMWILLVAAGSGYLARCWHKTLKPKPQLTDHPHNADHDSSDPPNTDEDPRRVVDNTKNNNNTNNLFTSPSSSSTPQLLLEGSKETPLDAARTRTTPELAPKPQRKNFSPKAFSTTLVPLDQSTNEKSSKKETTLSSASALTSARHRGSAWDRLTASGGEKSSSQDGAAASGERSSSSSRRSTWSSFRSNSLGKDQAREGSPGATDDAGDSSGESSPSFLKRAGDSFRKSRRKSDSGSLSSRSLQGNLDGDGRDGRPASAGSSRREIDPGDSLSSSSRLTNRSLSSLGPVAAPEMSEPSSQVCEWPEVTSRRKAAVENESKSSSPDLIGQTVSSLSTIRIDTSSNSVAAVVARIEKGNVSGKAETVNAILSLRAANQAQTQSVAVTDIVKARKLKLEILEQNSVEDAEILLGGHGKRRAGDGGGKAEGGNGGVGKVGGLAAPLSTGKRTKDSKESNKGDSSGVTLTSITSKWTKDASFVPKDVIVGDFDEASTSDGLGVVDLSQVFFGFDSTFLRSPAEEISPFKFYRRSRQLSLSGRSNLRKMRESPRPVSALESCLRAQFPDRDNEGSRVARSLNFSSSSVSVRGQQRGRESLDPAVDLPSLKDGSHSDSPTSSSDGRGLGGGSAQQSPKGHIEGALGLPLLVTPPASKRSGSRGGFSSESGHTQLVESASKHQQKVRSGDRGRVGSSQSKLRDVLWRPSTLPVALKKRKVSQACSPSSNNSTHLQAKGFELEALVVPPMEGLLFCFGMGIGVMSLIEEPDEVERLSKELRKSEETIKNLNNLLIEARESPVVPMTASMSKEIVVAGHYASEEVVTVEVSGNKESPLDLQVTPDVQVTPALESPLDPLSVTPAIEESERPFDLYRREAPETPQQTEHMAELEAELEAELDALTSCITDVASSAPDFEELDPEGVAGVADRDLGVEGLPAVVDWDDDNDDFITEEPVHGGGGVPPRELSRLLRKVQNSRQEHRIAELEADLQEAVEKLRMSEKELQLLKEKTTSFAPPLPPATLAGSSDAMARTVSVRLVQSDDSSWSAKIEQLNRNVFEDQESRREDINKSGVKTPDRNTVDTEKLSFEQSAPSGSVRQEHGSIVLASVASEPTSILDRSVDSNPSSHLPVRATSDPVSRLVGSRAIEFGLPGAGDYTSGREESTSGSISQIGLRPTSRTASSARRSVSSMFSSEESMNGEAQADNDAVCDEFLSSVFCSPDSSQLGFSSVMSSPLNDLMPQSPTPEEHNEASIMPEEALLDTMPSVVAEDLDQVVGQLLKKDSSSVKNAINAFLRWEAAEQDDPSREDDTDEEEDVLAGGYSRRAAGQNPTPQKTPVLTSVPSSGTPQKSSVISTRLEHLARSAFTTEKMPYPSGSLRRLGSNSEERSPRVGGSGRTLEVFQKQLPPLAKLEDRSSIALGLWEYPVAKKDHSAHTPRRGGVVAGKVESPVTDTLRDLLRGESPVFGGGDSDYQALYDTRRELRYSSSKVQLSLAGPPDTSAVFRHRDDPTRAGISSPIGRVPARNAFQSPKLKHSRMALENRLYQNPTSDWLSEVGSPPDFE